ncbi:unnamed protein product, partial [Candidula unifasciata]
LYRQFPAMAPNASSPDWPELEGEVEFQPGKGRSAGVQSSFQLIALAVTSAMAVVSGLIVGVILKWCTFLGQPVGDRLFEDSPLWTLSELEKQKSSASRMEGSRAPLLGSLGRGDIRLQELKSS